MLVPAGSDSGNEGRLNSRNRITTTVVDDDDDDDDNDGGGGGGDDGRY